MKRVALYVRVSTAEQKNHGLSVESQIEALQAYAKENKYKVVGIYNDAGISAHISYKKRPALLKLIEDCNNSKVDLILFTKLDRWFRSLKDYYAVESALEGSNVAWKAIWEDYETETSAGKFKVNIMLSIAQAEAERTSERIRSVFEYKKSKGEFIGKPPIGYKIVDKKLVIDENLREIVSEMFRLYLEYHSVHKVHLYTVSMGQKWVESTISKLLKSESYIGNCAGYQCEPYITLEQHNEIKRMLHERTRTAKDNKVYIFAAMCRCGYCGQKMKSHTSYHHYTKHYYCSGWEKIVEKASYVSISERYLEKYLLDNIEELIESYNSNSGSKNKQQDISKKIKSIKAKIDRVGIRFEDGDISVEEYKKKRKQLMDELQELEMSMTDVVKVVSLPPEWKLKYNALDEEHKHYFWTSIIKEIIVTNENKTAPQVVF